MIQLNHVYKTFFKGKDMEVRALDDVTMTVKDGDFVTITGPSGSGKSTLMRVVEGMECADQGNCILNGIDLAKSSDKKRAEIRNQKMGIVLQDFGLFNDQTVKQNLQLPFLIAKRSIKSANIRAQEILEYYGWDGAKKGAARRKEAPPPPPGLDFLQGELYNLLLKGDFSMQQIVDLLGKPAAEVSTALTMLELRGIIERLPGNTFGLKL